MNALQKKQFRRKLATTTTAVLPSLLGLSIALPIISATTLPVRADNIVVDNTEETSAETSFDDSEGTPAIEVRGADGKLTLTAETVEAHTTNTPPIKKYSVYANTGGEVVVEGHLNASSNSQQGHVLLSTGSGSIITLNSANLTVGANASNYTFGINATSGGQVTASGLVEIEINRGASNAINVLGTGSRFESTNHVDITINQGGSHGVAVDTGGQVELNTIDIYTQGESSRGIDVRGGGQLTANNVNIETTGGVDAYGILVSNAGSKVTLGGGIITNTASDPDEYAFQGSSALRTRSQAELEVTGTIALTTSVVGAEGARATGGSKITLNNTDIITNSAISDGLSIGRLVHPWESGSGTANSSIVSNGTLNIQTNDATSFGVKLAGDGAVLDADGENSNGSIHAAGTAIRYQAGTNQSASLRGMTLTHDGEAETFTTTYYPELHQNVNNAGNLIQVGGTQIIRNYTGGVDDTATYNDVEDAVTNSSLTLIDSTATAEDNRLLLHVTSSNAGVGSSFTFNNVYTHLRGGIVTDEGSTLAMSLDDFSTWTVTKDSNLTSLTNTEGFVVFDDNDTFKSLRTNNYTGGANSYISFNTQLGDDSSPTDLLIIDGGSAQGTSGVFVNNVNGAGAATVNNGIKLVDAINGATTNSDSFYLVGGPVAAGLNTYDLFRGGQSADTLTDDDWFLRSTGFRDETPAVAVFPVLGWRTALASLPNLSSRFRNQSDSEGEQRSARLASLNERLDGMISPKTSVKKDIWADIFSEGSKFKSGDAANTGFDTTTTGAQAGIDFLARENAAGRRSYAGVYLAHASSGGDVLRQNNRIGSIDFDNTSVGVYFTQYTPRGWYVDGVAQYSRLHNLKTRINGDTINTDGASYTLSIEGGRQLNRTGKFIIEPQAQLIYSRNSVDDAELSDSTQINISTLNAVTGRLGVRIHANPQRNKRFLPWLRANLWHTLNDDSKIRSGGSTLSTPIGSTIGEIQLGVSSNPRNNGAWSFHGSVGYQADLGGPQYSGWKGTIGLRKGW